MAQHLSQAEYYDVNGQLLEINRQLRQPAGYPFDPDHLKMALQEIIEGRFMAKELANRVAAQTFSLLVEGNRKTSELIVLGKYDWFNDLITDERLPIAPHTPVRRMIEYVTLDHDPDSEEVLAEFARRGFERPTYEDALYFGIQYPDEQRKAFLVWLHEPVQGPEGSRHVLVSYESDRGRSLDLYWFDRRWYRFCVFPAVRK